MMQRDIAATLAALWIGAFAVASSGAEIDYSDRLTALVNQYRVSHGHAALTSDTTIAGLARAHSVAMAKSGKLNHDDFLSRVERSGRAMCVENIGWNYRSPSDQVDAWCASPGHNRNMLNPRVDRIGIGDASGYVTMIACGK